MTSKPASITEDAIDESSVVGCGLQIVSLPHKLDAYREDSRRILEEGISGNFQSVVVIGLCDGQVYISSSSNVSRLEFMGAIEVAKQHLWSHDS